MLAPREQKREGCQQLEAISLRSTICSKAKATQLGGLCFGADGGTRTRDLLITNQLLYQLRHISGVFHNIAIIPQTRKFCNRFLKKC